MKAFSNLTQCKKRKDTEIIARLATIIIPLSQKLLNGLVLEYETSTRI
jgi:hypothetical protein